MKCVVGVDLEGRSRSAIDFLGHLRFDVTETLLLHASESMNLVVPFGDALPDMTDQDYVARRKSGDQAMLLAHHWAEAYGLQPKSEMRDGFPAPGLLKAARHFEADLIAVTTKSKSPIGVAFAESIARELVISASQSILIARDGFQLHGPIRAVFATDQSRYCDACANLLIEFAPKGIEHLTLLTVVERHAPENRHMQADAGSGRPIHDGTHRAQIERGDQMAGWLTKHGIPTESMVEVGRVESMIHNVLKEKKADLLILGSQGHQFLDRLVHGSTSLHELGREPFPVLLLRLPAIHLIDKVD